MNLKFYPSFLLVFGILLCLYAWHADAANILSVAFIGTKSHKLTYEPLLHELAARGHTVTILSQAHTKKKVKNVKDILTIDFDKMGKESMEFNVFEMKEKNVEINPFKMLQMFGHACEQSYDLPIVRELLNEKFDLVLVEALFNECVAGLVHKLNATSLILLSPVAVPTFTSELLGSPAPLSFIPGMMAAFTDKMTFYERFLNFMGEVTLILVRNWSFKPTMEDIYRRKLNDPTIPSSDDVFRKASLVLSCSHFSVGQPRPFLPDIIEVGGMHLKPAKPLPSNFAAFANGSAPHGFIFFSFGSALHGSEMPEKYRQIFLRVFSKLKQKVLWKWETETMVDLPSNVMLSKWVPQQDILGHKNCKLFLTHGGLGGTTEAIYHGVPLVGIPMFGDQPLNMQKAQVSGYAVTIDYNDLSEENLFEAITRVINEPKFSERVKHLSSIYRDQFGKPLEKAVFWTEYILRHKGAPHLRSPARDLNFFQYHSLDVITAIALAVFLTVFAMFFLIRFLFRKLCQISMKTEELSVNNLSKKKN